VDAIVDEYLLMTYDVVYSFLKYNRWANDWHLHNYCYLLILDGIIEDVWRDWNISLGFGAYSWNFEYMLYKLLRIGWLKSSCIKENIDGKTIELCGAYVLPNNAVKPKSLIISGYIKRKTDLIELVYKKVEDHSKK